MAYIERVVEPAFRSAHSERLVKGAERSSFYVAGDLGRTFTLLGDDGDHSTKRIGAIKTALGAAQHLNTLDIGGRKVAEVKRTVGIAWVADLDAIYKDLNVVGVRAAHKHRSLPSRTPGLDDIETGNGLQRVRHRPALLQLQILRSDDRDRARHLVGGREDGGWA